MSCGNIFNFIASCYCSSSGGDAAAGVIEHLVLGYPSFFGSVMIGLLTALLGEVVRKKS